MRLAVPRREIDDAALVAERSVTVVDPVARNEFAPTSSCSDVPSALIVRARVVQAVAELIRTNGFCLDASREAARPPTVCTKRAEPSLTTGSACKMSNATPGTTSSRPEAERRRSDQATPGIALSHDPPVLDLDPRPQLIRLAKAIGVAQRVEITWREHLGRRLVVVADPDLERQLRQSRDRL